MLQGLLLIIEWLSKNVLLSSLLFVFSSFVHLTANSEQVRDFLKISELPHKVKEWEGFFFILMCAWLVWVILLRIGVFCKGHQQLAVIKERQSDTIRNLSVSAIRRLRAILTKEDDYYRRGDSGLYELFDQNLVRRMTREEEQLRGHIDAVRHVKAEQWVEALWEKRPSLFRD